MDNKIVKPVPKKKSRSTTPVGGSSSSQGQKHKNTFGACLRCKYKKIKCDLGPADRPVSPPCAACRRSRSHCFFNAPKVKIGKLGNILDSQGLQSSQSTSPTSASMLNAITQSLQNHRAMNGNQNMHLNNLSNLVGLKNQNLEGVSLNSPNTALIEACDRVKSDTAWKLELTSMQSALEFLAKATKLRNDYKNNEPFGSTRSDAASTTSETRDLSEKDNGNESDSTTNSTSKDTSTRSSYPSIEAIKPEVPTPSNHNYDLLGDGKLVTMDEARMLVNIFFNFMHPFYPYIPLHLQDFDELFKYPLLLHCILAISARYNPFDKVGFDNGIEGNRNVIIHNKLWTHCQQLLSQTVWSQASTRSIGTTLAFLLFTEWNPRAIHWEVSDTAHYLSDNNVSSSKEDPDGLGGIATVKRSDRMAWMFTGTAIRLAQEMDILENNAKIYTAANIAEICYASNMNLKPTLGESLVSIDGGMKEFEIDNPKSQDDIENEDLLKFVQLVAQNKESTKKWAIHKAYSDKLKEENPDLIIDLETEFLNDEYSINYLDENSSFLKNPIPYTTYQKAQLELLRIVTITYQTIYSEKMKKRVSSVDQKKNLMILDVLSPILNAWYLNYYKLMKPVSDEKPVIISLDDLSKFKRTANIRGESFISDYYYCQLYTFSLALQVEVKESKLTLNEMIKSARFVEQAYRAAKEILKSAIRVHKVDMLKYMPVRWVMRIVRSASFIVKCYITLCDHSMATNSEAKSILKLSGILVDDTVHMIRQAAVILKESTPDELHLASKFSTILMFLCKEIDERKRDNENLMTGNGLNNDLSLESQSTHKESLEASNHDTISSDAQEPPSENDSSHDTTTQGTANSTRKVGPNSIDEIGQFTAYLPEDVIDWFSASNNIGLDFVEPWTELIEQKYIQNKDGFQDFDQLFDEFAIRPS